MIVKHYELKNNLKENVNYFLLYGQNIGLIEELIDKNLKPIFSKNIFKYDETEILSDLDGFKEGLFNKSFFESDKLIIINRASDKILDIIKEISQKSEKKIITIYEASDKIIKQISDIYEKCPENII